MKEGRALEVAVTDGRGRRLRAQGLVRWLVHVAPPAARGDMSVALVSDAKMRALNRRFRGRSQATDVLSFPTDPNPRLPGFTPRLLGDVVIATGVARRQAHAAGHAVEIEFRRLALHGLLHLLGYDHKRDDGKMARLERRLLRKGGVSVQLEVPE